MRGRRGGEREERKDGKGTQVRMDQGERRRNTLNDSVTVEHSRMSLLKKL